MVSRLELAGIARPDEVSDRVIKIGPVITVE